MNEIKFTNHLINETSPYLLQHAHNPVDWYAWGDEALQRSKEEDKPILVSIGYSACHWCHVMEKESFEDESTAELMNKYFINIKIDREERPDIDHIYMDAVQAITGSGGWPLNVFLTPDLKPFYGGTYFPPVRSYNLLSWKELLEAINNSFRSNREEINLQAENLINHVSDSNSLGINLNTNKEVISKDSLQKIVDNILQTADKEWGGFGKAPKFPQTFIIQYLLRHYHLTKHEPSLKQAVLSLDKMIHGGIYDHLGGGFARYSTDTQWKAPHFEKMLYDNALLLQVLSEAYQLTKKELYSDVIRETIAFIQRELYSPEKGFYSALDADSEGIEGKYYVWSKNEIDEVLKEDSDAFCKVYNITEKGNWEHTNILWMPQHLENIAEDLNINFEELKVNLKKSRQILLEHRQKRVRPSLDDKILLGWNCLIITALCKACSALGNESFKILAEENILFIENNFKAENGDWYHTWKNGQAKYPAFLDDYASLINAYIHLQEITGNQEYLFKASLLTEKVAQNFADQESDLFYFTSYTQKDVVVRKKEIYDGATPSGNSLMAFNLNYLSTIFNRREWRERAHKMIQSLQKAIVSYPTSFGCWANVLQAVVWGFTEIAVAGNNYESLLKQILYEYYPLKVIQSSDNKEQALPLLQNREGKNGKPLIYVCKNYSCQMPVENINDMKKLIQKL